MWSFAFKSMRHMLMGPVTLLVYIWYCLVYESRKRFGIIPYVILGVPFIPVNILYNWIIISESLGVRNNETICRIYP